MDTTKTITHISLCAGYGGIDLGLKRAIPNLRTIAFSEIEAFACANLVSKMEAGLLDAAPIWTDLKTFPWSDFRDRVDILSGGYPCQPFSAAGKRLGKDDPRHLWPFIADGIRAMRPRVCFFENVEGHISLGLREVVSELESIGYTTTWGIFSAREVGAPHQRKRVFILAHRKGEGLERYDGLLAGCHKSRRNTSEQEGQVGWSNSGGNAWPSRPGEQQHGWEPPRVVADSKKSGRNSQRIAGDMDGEVSAEESRGHQLAPTIADCGDTGASEDADAYGGSGLCRGEEPEYQHTNLPSEPSSGNAGMQKSCGVPSGIERQEVAETGQSSESMGYSEHDGLPTKSILRGDEATGDERRTQEPHQAWQLTGADRPSDVPSIQGSTSRSESMGNSTEQGCEGSGRQDDSGRSIFRSSKSDGSSSNRPMESAEWQAQPSLGGDSDGITNWLGDAELYTTCDNRTDELRLLGNGVVPATAERAFRTLLTELQ